MARRLGLLCVCIGADSGDSVDSADSTFSVTVWTLRPYFISAEVSRHLATVLQYWYGKKYCNQYCNTFSTNI